MSIDLVMSSNCLILCHPLLLLPSIFPSIKVFSNKSSLHIRWPKYGASASPSVLPVNTQDWFPLGWTGWVSLQFKGSQEAFSTAIRKHQLFSSAFFMVQLSRPYMTTGKIIALAIWTFVTKTISLLFNTLGIFHGWRSLVGCSPWGRYQSDMTEQLHFHFSLSCIGEGNGNPLQCSCLENPRDSRASWAAIYGVAQSRTRLKRLSSSSSSSSFVIA